MKSALCHFAKWISAVLCTVISSLCRRFHIAYLPFIEDYEGLGNRIKAMANVWTMGCRQIIMAWRVDGWVNMPFDSLFEMRDCNIHSYSGGGYRFFRFLFRRFLPNGIFCENKPFWSFHVPSQFQRDKYRHVWSFSPKETFSIDFRFNDIDEDIRAYFRPFFECLMPSEKVRRRIDEAAIPDDVVTVQVRNSGLSADAKDVCSIETFFAAMDRYAPDQFFFISTMNTSISKLFHEKYGERVLELPAKNPDSLIDAVADMWLLGHGREMIVSPKSTFSEVAWWWGGAEIPVCHLKSEYNQAIRREA